MPMTDKQLKAEIADAIFNDPEGRPFDFGRIDAAASGIESIEFQRINSLSTQIRVKTGHDVHYYQLVLSEGWA